MNCMRNTARNSPFIQKRFVSSAVVELFVELLQVRVAIVDRSKDLPPDMTEVRGLLPVAGGFQTKSLGGAGKPACIM